MMWRNVSALYLPLMKKSLRNVHISSAISSRTCSKKHDSFVKSSQRWSNDCWEIWCYGICHWSVFQWFVGSEGLWTHVIYLHFTKWWVSWSKNISLDEGFPNSLSSRSKREIWCLCVTLPSKNTSWIDKTYTFKNKLLIQRNNWVKNVCDFILKVHNNDNQICWV